MHRYGRAGGKRIEGDKSQVAGRVDWRKTDRTEDRVEQNLQGCRRRGLSGECRLKGGERDRKIKGKERQGGSYAEGGEEEGRADERECSEQGEL